MIEILLDAGVIQVKCNYAENYRVKFLISVPPVKFSTFVCKWGHGWLRLSFNGDEKGNRLKTALMKFSFRTFCKLPT
jgi:hypothetical protein